VGPRKVGSVVRSQIRVIGLLLLTPFCLAAAPHQSAVEIISIESRIIERNEVWWRVSWKLTLKNGGADHKVLDADVSFQDSEGFILDDMTERGLVLPSGQERTFNGYALVNADVAASFRQIGVEVMEGRVTSEMIAALGMRVSNIRFRTTERNDVWWKMSWQLTVQNAGDDVGQADVLIEFVDSEGFVVDDQTEHNVRLSPGQSRNLSGYALINAEVAGKVSAIQVEAK